MIKGGGETHPVTQITTFFFSFHGTFKDAYLLSHFFAELTRV